jgi:hypothetical protein
MLQSIQSIRGLLSANLSEPGLPGSGLKNRKGVTSWQ